MSTVKQPSPLSPGRCKTIVIDIVRFQDKASGPKPRKLQNRDRFTHYTLQFSFKFVSSTNRHLDIGVIGE